MPEEIEHSVVRISPDFTGFKAQFNAKLKAALTGASVKVKVSEVTGLKTALTAAARTTSGFKAKVGEVTGLAAALNRASSQAGSIKVKLDADTRTLEAKLARIAAKTITIKVKYDVDRTTMPRLPAGGGGNRGGSGGSGGSVGGGSGVFSTLGGAGGFNAIQGQLIALGVLLSGPITSGVLGLASAFAIAGTATAAFSLAAVGHITQLTNVMKLVNEQGVQLKDLPAPMAAMVSAVQQFQSRWTQFLTDTRAPVFQVFTRGLAIASDGLTKFTPIVNIVAGAFGRALDSVGAFANGPAMSRFLQTVQAEAPAAIQSLTNSAVNLGSGLLNVFTDFAPAGQSMLKTIEDLTLRFSKWTDSFGKSDGFQKFLAYAQANGPKVLEVFANLATFAVKLVGGLAPIGALAINMLQGFTALLAKISPGAWVGTITSIVALWAAFKAYVILTSVVRGFVLLKDTIVGLTYIVGLCGGAVATLSAFFRTLTVTELISGFGALLVAVGIVAAAFYTLSSADKTAAEATEKHKSIVQEFADALRESNGLINDNIKLTTAKALSDKGVLAAGGVDPKKALSGALGNKADFDATMAELDRRAKAARSAASAAGSEGESGRNVTEGEAKALRDKADTLEAAANAYRPYGSALSDATAKNNLLNQALGKDAFGVAIDGANGYTLALRAAADRTGTLMAAWQQLQQGTDSEQLAKTFVDIKEKFEQAKRATATAEANIAKVNKDTAHANEQAQKSRDDAGLREIQTRKDVALANEQASRRVQRAEENLSDTRRGIADSNQQSLDRVREAQDRATRTSNDARDAIYKLNEARRQAARAIEDSVASEESASIRLERARRDAFSMGLYKGPIQSDYSLRSRETSLSLTDAQTAYNRQIGETEKLKRDGVNGAPGVIDAQKQLADSVKEETKSRIELQRAQTDQSRTQEENSRRLRDATQELRDAERDRADTAVDGDRRITDAHNAVKDAQYNLDQTIANGKIARDEAIQSRNDAAAAEQRAQIEYDKSRQFIDNIATSQGITTEGQKTLREELAKALQMDAGNVLAQLQDIQSAIEAIRNMAKDPNLSAHDAFEQAKNTITHAGDAIKFGPGQHVGPQNKAIGGPIIGQGSGTSDSIYARGPVPGVDYWLSNNEHVWTADEVRGAGGHDNVKKMRAAAKYGKHSYADGGPVLFKLAGDYKSIMEGSGILDVAAANLGFMPKGGAGGNLGQQAIALAAYSAAKSMGASDRVMLALFEAGYVESKFQNYANKNVPASMNIPHDAVGSDHDSVGFLQQRPGWGSVDQRMDTRYAAMKFLQKAMNLDNKFKGSAGELAAKVQVPAAQYRDKYDKAAGQAQAFLNAAIAAAIGAVPGAQHYTVEDILAGRVIGKAGTGEGGPGPGFLPWPSSPAATQYDTGVWKNVKALVAGSGIPNDPGSNYRKGSKTESGNPDWHSAGRAVDFMGYNQDRLAQWLWGRMPNILELIHATDKAKYGISRGHEHNMGGTFNSHYNHLHLAMRKGGPVLMDNGRVVADAGAVLPPMSRTLVENRTNKPESVGFGGDIQVKVFVGERELEDIVVNVVDTRDDQEARRFKYGRSRS